MNLKDQILDFIKQNRNIPKTSEYVTYTDIRGKLDWDFLMSIPLCTRRFKYWRSVHTRRPDLLEVTIGKSKGSLYKMRVYRGDQGELFFKLLRGTVLIAYCTKIVDVLKLIPEDVPLY